MMSAGFRRHQVEGQAIVNRIIAGEPIRRVVGDIVPGGGKSGLFVLFASGLLQAGLIDQFIWLVPRASLAEQAEEDFANRLFNPHGYSIRFFRENIAPLIRSPHVGAVATYQALHASPRLYIDAVSRKRTLLGLDEVQCLGDEEEGVSWTRNVLALAEQASYRLACSGTLFRNNGTRIQLIPYTDPDESGICYPVRDIVYPYVDALAESAVIPMEIVLNTGKVKYDYNGDTFHLDLDSAPAEEERRALNTFLSRPETLYGVVDRCVDHWREWRAHMYPSRMIVIANRQKEARALAEYLHTKKGMQPVLAISDEGEASQREITAFRRDRKGDVLVTVGMAYIGLNVPDITHIAFLSNIRSIGYLMQALFRNNRYDRNAYWTLRPEEHFSYPRQCAYSFVPDDPRMRAFAEWLREQTRIGIREREKRNPPEGPGPEGPEQSPEAVFTPIDAKLGKVSYEDMGGRLSPQEQAIVENLRLTCREAAGMPHTHLAAILRSAAAIQSGGPGISETSTATEEPPETPTQREQRKRRVLDSMCRRLDGLVIERDPSQKWGYTNGELVKRFKKRRTEMSEPEIDESIKVVRSWLQHAGEDMNDGIQD
jgi:superfamily II DNA or RNA helicase